MALEDVVNVQVNINQATVAQQGFGVPLIYGHHDLPFRVMTFRAGDWNKAMVDEGFDKASAIYQCAEQMMMQSPRPATFKVGRATSALVQLVSFAPTTEAEGTNFSVEVTLPDGSKESAVYVAIPGDTFATICDGLAAALDTIAGISAEASTNGTAVEVTSDSDQIVSYAVSKTLDVSDRTTIDPAEVASDLDAIRDEDDGWYALCLTSGSPELILAAAEWVEINRKLMVASTSDSSVFDPEGGLVRDAQPERTDIAWSVSSLGYVRTHVAYHSQDGQFYGPTWASMMITWEPGQADWKFKTLRGVTVDKITSTQESWLLKKNASYYESLAGEPSTGAAMGGDGTFLDLVQLSDWLRARITEGIVAMFKGPPKVPFTDEGGGNAIWGVLRGVALLAITNTAIMDDPNSWSVFVPKRATLPPADIIARRWTGAILNVTPTGAVHSVDTIVVNVNVAAS